MMLTISHRVRKDIRGIIVADAGERNKLTTMKTLELREKLIEPFLVYDYGDMQRFERLPLFVLKELIEGDFVDMGSWNNCPGVEQLFLPLMEKHPSYCAHGYVISHDRADKRITVEGLETSCELSTDDLADFFLTFKGADTLRFLNGVAYCWYD
jgi:hypothetical protein